MNIYVTITAPAGYYVQRFTENGFYSTPALASDVSTHFTEVNPQTDTFVLYDSAPLVTPETLADAKLDDAYVTCDTYKFLTQEEIDALDPNKASNSMNTEHEIIFHEAELTSEQIKNLVATDVELVPAPGANKVLVLAGPVVLTMIPAETTPATYTWANSDHGLFVGDANMDSDAEAQALIEAAHTSRFSAVLRAPAGSSPLTENQAIKIGASGTGEAAAGNGTLKVKFPYMVIDVTE